MSHTLAELAGLTATEFTGDGSCVVETVADIATAEAGSIAFISDLKYRKYLSETAASALIISPELQAECHLPAIITAEPRLVYARIANILFPAETYAAGISPHAHIADSATVSATACIEAGAVIADKAVIGDNSYIGACAVIEHHASIGSNTVIHASVTVGHHCSVGDDSILHSGAVLGADGFGFVRDGSHNIKIPQAGAVRVGNDVEIGACTSIDRGALEDTVICDGVKLDNQIQVAHSVHIGANTIISAATAIAGSTRIGENCMIGGCTGIREHIEIADNVMITARTLVTHSITRPGSSYSSSTPMDETASWRKNSARFRQLDKMARRITELEKQLKKLTAASDNAK